MSTVTKTFVFASDAEGLADAGNNSDLVFEWVMTDGSPASGCVQFRSILSSSTMTEYARRASTGQTWETWGVPAGSTVKSVRITGYNEKTAVATMLSSHSIKMRIINSGGTTVHSAGDLIDDSLDTSVDLTWQSASAGSSRNVDSSYQASNTDVRLELEYTATTTMSPMLNQYFDTIAVEITYVSEYFVIAQHPSASDSNAGTSASAPWLTFGKATATVAAGDTVNIGGDHMYREMVTLATAGSSGSEILWKADITGEKTGYAGKVVVCAHDDDLAAGARTAALNLNGKTFNKFYDITFIGGTSFVVGNSAFASATAYEGDDFVRCVMVTTSRTNALSIELNAGVTPSTTGLRLLGCKIYGGVNIDWDSNGTAHVDSKFVMDSCLVVTSYANQGLVSARNTNGGSFGVGGFIITNNTFFSASHGTSFTNFTNTTNPHQAFNNVFLGCQTAFASTLNTSGFMVAGNNRFMNCSTFYGAGITVYEDDGVTQVNANIMVGGLHDGDLVASSGLTPFKFFEPVQMSGYTNPTIDKGTSDYDYGSTEDAYGLPRAMGRPSVWQHTYRMDGSDAAASGTSWTNPTNSTDNDPSSFATTTTAGSESSNVLLAEGTDAPASGGTIKKVYVRARYAASSGTITGKVKIFTNGLAEALGTLTLVTSGATILWSDWTELTAPSGGWGGTDWTTVQSLEMKSWKETAGATGWRLYLVQIAVVDDTVAIDVGAVESNPLVTQDTTVYNIENYSAKYPNGTSQHTDYIEVAASTAYKIRCSVKWDSNYSGTKPQLIVSNIPGVSDITVTASGSADTWYTLETSSFTPTADGTLIVTMKSNDASLDGNCWIGDLYPVFA